MDEPLAKKRRICKWNPEWSRYNLRESSKGPGFAYCNICVIDLSVAGGGICEVKRHIQTKRHKEGVMLCLISNLPCRPYYVNLKAIVFVHCRIRLLQQNCILQLLWMSITSHFQLVTTSRN